MSVSVAEKLGSAWRHRFDQRNDECLVMWSELREELQIPKNMSSVHDVEDLFRREDAADAIDMIILQASLARTQKRFEESRRILSLVERVYHSSASTLPARFCIEQGLNYTLEGAFSQALECFLTGVARAPDSFQKLAALSNAIFCFDQLGIPHADLSDKAWELLRLLGDEPGIRGIKMQLAHLDERHQFRKGQFAKLFSEESNDATLADQSVYFRLWVSALPFHRYHRFSDHSLGAYAQSLNVPFMKGYRSRTLLRILHPDDLQMPKPSEWVDRIYLWVWRWLINPEGQSLRRILAILSQLAQHPDAIEKFSTEDRALFRNALSWLSLFDQQVGQQLQPLLAANQNDTGAFSPLLKFEELFVHYLNALRDGNDLLAFDYRVSLEMSPLWSDESLYFKKIVQTIEDEGAVATAPQVLHQLIKSLRNLCSRKGDSGSRFKVDMINNELLDHELGSKVYSETMCKAINCLQRTKSIRTEAFLSICFGIKKMEPEIHNQKIFNLLQRMKKIFTGVLTFRTKDGLVIADGDFSAISIVHSESASLLLKDQPEWQEFAYVTLPSIRAMPIRRQLKDRDMPDGEMLSRRDLEKYLGRSRASVNRLLEDWGKRGWIERHGQARSTIYRLKKAGQDALKREIACYS